jgi:hypothetical protein
LVAAVLPKVIAVAPAVVLNPVPVMVTIVLPVVRPLFGLRAVTLGAAAEVSVDPV